MFRIISSVFSESTIVPSQFHRWFLLSFLLMHLSWSGIIPNKPWIYRQVIPSTKWRFPSLTGRGSSPRPAQDASPLHPDKELPPLNSAKGIAFPLTPCSGRSDTRRLPGSSFQIFRFLIWLIQAKTWFESDSFFIKFLKSQSCIMSKQKALNFITVESLLFAHKSSYIDKYVHFHCKAYPLLNNKRRNPVPGFPLY